MGKHDNHVPDVYRSWSSIPAFTCSIPIDLIMCSRRRMMPFFRSHSTSPDTAFPSESHTNFLPSSLSFCSIFSTSPTTRYPIKLPRRRRRKRIPEVVGVLLEKYYVCIHMYAHINIKWIKLLLFHTFLLVFLAFLRNRNFTGPPVFENLEMFRLLHRFWTFDDVLASARKWQKKECWAECNLVAILSS